MSIDSKAIQSLCDTVWEDELIPKMKEFIRIPNKSPSFDPDWEKNGYMQAAVDLVSTWVQTQNIQGLRLNVYRKPGRTPMILIEIPGQGPRTVLMYGHIDKQPEMQGWQEGLSPWEGVLREDKLYGRGAADDGYAVFSSILALKAVKAQNLPHSRIVILIEASEESGSSDLPFYVNELEQEIGKPDLVICLDSGCGNYDQLWHTTSLRGLVNGVLSIEVLSEGVHSGSASGIVPSSFRILRQLLSRIENKNTGDILLSAFHVDIPEERIQEARLAAGVLGNTLYTEFPLKDQLQPVSENLSELLLNRTWRPALSVIGCDGLPALANAGNVLRPKTEMALSIRIPPSCDAEKATEQLKKTLEADPPYQAKVSFTAQQGSNGWHAPLMKPWLKAAISEASELYFGREAMAQGEGGTIPFMGMLGEKFPEAQFLITGVLGPHSNAHGPNEFLHIPTVKRLTACIAHVLALEAVS